VIGGRGSMTQRYLFILLVLLMASCASQPGKQAVVEQPATQTRKSAEHRGKLEPELALERTPAESEEDPAPRGPIENKVATRKQREKLPSAVAKNARLFAGMYHPGNAENGHALYIMQPDQGPTYLYLDVNRDGKLGPFEFSSNPEKTFQEV